MKKDVYLFRLLNMSEVKKELLASIIGLVRAKVENNASTDHTMCILEDALFMLKSGEDKDCEEEISKVRKEKALLAPDCAVCANPCGRTADYPMSEFKAEDLELQEMKAQMLFQLLDKLADIDWEADSENVLRGLFMFGYEKDAGQFRKFLEEAGLDRG